MNQPLPRTAFTAFDRGLPELRGFFLFSEGLDLVVLVARMMEKLKVDIRVAKLRGRLSSSARSAKGLRERKNRL